MNPGIFQTILNLLQANLGAGLTHARPVMLGIFTFLCLMECVRLGIGLALGGTDLVRSLMRFVLRGGVLLWILLDLPLVSNTLLQSFVGLGLRLGGNSLTPAQMLDPGTVLQQGIRVGEIFYEALISNLGLTSIPLALAYLLAWVFLILAFGVIAINIFIIQVEISIAIPLIAVLLPFAMYHGTGWLAQGSVAYPINLGLRVTVLAFLASATFPILNTLVATQATLKGAVITVILVWTLAFLFWKGPTIAAGILSGIPALSAGQVIGAAAGTVAVGAAGAGVAVAGAGLAGASAGAGIRGLTAARGLLTGGGTSGQQLAWNWAPKALPQATRQLAQAAPSLSSRTVSTGRATLHTLSQASRYFSHDGGGGGTNTHLP